MNITSTKALLFSVLFSTTISSIIVSSEKPLSPGITKFLQKNLSTLMKHAHDNEKEQMIIYVIGEQGEKSVLPTTAYKNHQDLLNKRSLAISKQKIITLPGRMGPVEILLLDCKPSHNVKDLTYVANSENKKMLKLLLSQEGIDINQQGYDGNTALIYATNKGLTEAVRLLLEHEADVDQQTYEGGPTPLTIAAAGGHSTIVQLLLKNRAAADKQIQNGHTALMFAASYGKQKIVSLLLSHNASPTRQETNGRTSLTIAQENGYPEIVTLFTDKKD